MEKKTRRFQTWPKAYWNYVLEMFPLSSVTFESKILNLLVALS